MTNPTPTTTVPAIYLGRSRPGYTRRSQLPYVRLRFCLVSRPYVYRPEPPPIVTLNLILTPHNLPYARLVLTQISQAPIAPTRPNGQPHTIHSLLRYLNGCKGNLVTVEHTPNATPPYRIIAEGS